MNKKIWEKNLKCLRRRIPLFVELVERDFPQRWKYTAETAKNGSTTMTIEHEGKTFPIHSRYDPEKEALQQIKAMNYRNPKMLIILGLGLGYHIRACLEELAKENIWIVVIERDIPALKFAVQNVDLTDLFEAGKIRWVLGVPEADEALAVCTDMIKHAGPAFQLYLKTLVIFEHPALAKVHGEYHKLMVRNFRQAAHSTMLNYGTCPDDSLMGVENIMKNLEVILRNPGVKDMKGAFKGVPGLLVSTGPSLDKNIKDLQGVPDRCVMICADSALSILTRNGIMPHAFATLERVMETVQVYKNIPEEIMKQVWLAGTPVIRPEGYEAWKGPTFITYRDFAHFVWIGIDKGTLKIGPSCSNMGFKILEYLGCDPIILVGQDCAFESVKKTHADGAHDKLMPEGFNESQFVYVKGNYQDQVPTDQFFELFRKHFVTDVAHFAGKVINCTAGGAFIEGTTLMPLIEAVEKYCTKPVPTLELFKKRLKYPPADELQKVWKTFRKTMTETMTEVNAVIDYCDEHDKVIQDFEKELDQGGFTEIEDFLARFPDERVNQMHDLLTKARGKVILFGKYFNLYLMHIVQMVIIRFEMDLNEIPTLCDNEKRGKLQAIRLMKSWFPTIRDICKISLKLLVDAKKDLETKFGEL